MKKWSQKGIKSTLDANDELMIIDSTDANPATMNKRVKLFTATEIFHNFFEVQTVGAVTQSKSFLFNGSLTALVFIAASNAGNTMGLSATVNIQCTVTAAGNSLVVTPVSDFATANVSVSATSNSVTVDVNGEAGETITWRAKIYIVGV